MLEDSNKVGSKRAMAPAEEVQNPSLLLGQPLGIPKGTLINQETYVTIFDETQNIPFNSA